MAKPFEFSEIQANHILDMPLRRLAQLEQQKLKDEHDELQATIKELESILQSDAKLRTVIKEELAEVKEEFAEPRRSQITLDAGELADLDFIEDEEVVLVLSHKGYVKTVANDAFRKQGRGGRGRARLEPEGRGLRRAPAHDDRALVPVVLLEPRPRLPAARARDPDEGAHRAWHRAR